MQPRRADSNNESPHHDNMDETTYLDIFKGANNINLTTTYETIGRLMNPELLNDDSFDDVECLQLKSANTARKIISAAKVDDKSQLPGQNKAKTASGK